MRAMKEVYVSLNVLYNIQLLIHLLLQAVSLLELRLGGIRHAVLPFLLLIRLLLLGWIQEQPVYDYHPYHHH